MSEKKEIIDIRIAEFMGYTFLAGHFYGKGSGTWFKNAKYSYSWDSLMPVCKKFDTLYETKDLMDNMDYIKHCDDIDDCVTTYNIVDTYLAINEAILWYNKTQQSK